MNVQPGWRGLWFRASSTVTRLNALRAYYSPGTQRIPLVGFSKPRPIVTSGYPALARGTVRAHPGHAQLRSPPGGSGHHSLTCPPLGREGPSQRAGQQPQLTTPSLAHPTCSLNTATSLHSGTPTNRAEKGTPEPQRYSLCFSSTGKGTLFVNASATLWTPGTLCSLRTQSFTSSLTQ
eukprot:531450-Rhodomonas_salina.2